MTEIEKKFKTAFIAAKTKRSGRVMRFSQSLAASAVCAPNHRRGRGRRGVRDVVVVSASSNTLL